LEKIARETDEKVYMTDKIVVLSSCGGEEEASRIAQSLIEIRLAACVTILPKVQSVYRWQGAVERSEEFLLIIKSSRALFEKLRAEIARLHSYDVPEVLALPVVDGAGAYLQWMDQELG
jgi:periplasmic divalent cation tolerance protein